MRRALTGMALALACAMTGDAQVVRNAGKYGAMLSWWYQHLPETTLYPPTIPWDARKPAWWHGIVRQAVDAKLGWVAAACWGQDTDADPIMLEPLLRAIDATGGKLKVALFDDTTSEVLRKNRAKGRPWATSPRFDLADLAGEGEGGFKYFYDQQWKRYFATVPARYRFQINGRPVVFMWHGGFEWYSNQTSFHALLTALRGATLRDFGTDPFIITEESWTRLDSSALPDALFDWFEPVRVNATLTSYRGVNVGHLIAGFNCLTCDPPHPIVERDNGAVFRAGMEAIGPKSDLVLLEGLVDVEENAHLVETSEWGRLYLNLIRYYATVIP